MVKVAETNSNFFGVADHGTEVIITAGVVEESKSGSQYIQLAFEQDGKEGNTGYNNYITEKALPYTAARVQGILTHNEPDEAKREAVREEVDGVADEEFGEWAIKNLIGKKAYLAIGFSDQINPRSGKPYLERNLQGYEPKPLQEPKASVAEQVTGGEPIDLSEIPF